MTNHVNGKVIAITGAASGFGKLIAEKASALGSKVCLADVDGEALRALADQITSKRGKALAHECDVTDLSQMKAMAQACVEAFGQIDVMINNAGIMPLAFFADHEQSAEAWSRCVDINFKGVLNGSIAVFDQMMAQKRGHILNISSIYGNAPVSGAGVYGATKAAVNYLSESLRIEARGAIKVTCPAPLFCPTKMAFL